MESGELIGYEHVSELHCTNKDWISDLVSASAQSNIQKDGRKLILREGTPWETFDRDCCLLLMNIFFAQGQGISFDEEALTILRQAQPEKKSEIDNYAIFGLKANRHADGLRGKSASNHWQSGKPIHRLARRPCALR